MTELSRVLFCLFVFSLIGSSSGKELEFNPGKWDAAWILPADPAILGKAKFIKEFEIKEIPQWANVSMTAEANSSISINGKEIGGTSSWIKPQAFNIVSCLKKGGNIVEIDVVRARNRPALLCEIVLWDEPSKCRKILSDSSWTVQIGDKKSGTALAPLITPKAGPAWGPLVYIYGGPLPDVKVTSFDIPDKKNYGEPLDISVSFSGDPVKYGADQLEVLMLLNGRIIRTLRPDAVNANTFNCSISKLPEWMPQGKYDMAWRRAGTSEKPHFISSTEISGPMPRAAVAEVKEYNGRPRLHVNGIPQPFLGMYTRSPMNLSLEHKIMGDAGRHLQFAGYYLTQDWIGAGKYNNFEILDTQIYALLNEDPDAKVMIWTNIYAPTWWKNSHPEELIKYADPVVNDSDHPARTLYDVSIASDMFKRDAGDALSALSRHIMSMPYRSRILGFVFGSANTGEWIWKGAVTPIPNFSDYSAPMSRYFQSYLRDKYRNDLVRLRNAWNNPSIDFSNAAPPAKQLWMEEPAQKGMPFHVNMQIMDYASAHSNAMADMIGYFAHIIRTESKERWITGAYYGYHLYLPRHCYLPMTGHLATGRLLRNPDIQLLDSPYTYYKRGPGGDGMPMSCLESVRLNGKLWVCENDVRTHLAVDSQEAPDARCFTEDDTLQVLRRDFALCLIRGFGSYWFSVAQPTRAWFIGKLFIDLAKEFQKIADEDLTRQFRSDARVAVIVDEESPKCIHPAYNILKPLLMEQFGTNMNRAGVPWDCYIASDLEKIADRYDVFIFANLFYLDDNISKTIETALKKNGKTLIWCYAPGAAYPENTLKYMSQLTGLDNMQENTPAKPLIHMSPSMNPVMWPNGLPALVTFYSDDSSAKILGRYTNGKPAILSKKLDGWNSIFVGALDLSPEGWRTVLKEAGLNPIMDSGDIVYFRDPWFAVHTKNEGLKTASLPSSWKSAVDIYHNKPYPVKDGSFSWDATAKTTYLFRRNDK